MIFSERLKELRADKQCTQKQLAIFLGLTPNSICEWENNRSEPSIETLVKLSNYFEVSVDYLLGVEDDFGAKVASPVVNSYTATEQQLIEDFRQLNYYKQELIKNNIKAMLPAEAESKQKKKR